MSRLILILFIGLFSCVSTKAPQKEKKARKKLAKHLEGVDNILKEHPDLSDTLTTVKYDTIVIDSHVVDTVFKTKIDTNKLDSIIVSLNNDTTVLYKDKIRYIRKEIIKTIFKDTLFYYSDSLIDVGIQVKDGTYVVKYVVNEKNLPVKTEIIHEIDTDCEKKMPFYKDYRNYLILLLVLLIILWRKK